MRARAPARGRYPRRFFNEREFPMRLIVLGVCLFAAACSGQALNSPTSPTNASLGPAQTAARGGTALPFRGSFTTVIDVPPPSAHADCRGYCDPPRSVHRDCSQLRSIPTIRRLGHSTSLRRTATNCLAHLLGEGVFIPPNTATRLPKVATIENGTGRFAGATGTFTMVTVRHYRFRRRRQGDWRRNVRRTRST